MMCKHLNPGEAAPAEVVPSPVKGYVQCIEVAGFPVEELKEVEVDEHSIDNRAELESIKLDWSNGKVDNKDSPSHHTSPTVGPLLDIHTKKAGMKLNPSIELVWQGGRFGSLRNLGEYMTWQYKVIPW